MKILFNIFTSFIRLIPTKLLIKLVSYVLYILGYRKQVINNNYNSTIGINRSATNFKPFYRKCLNNIARILIETLQNSKHNAHKTTYSHLSKLESLCVEHNGLILVASHYGNWELACINLPLHTEIPVYGVYKPLKNKRMDKQLIQLRSKFGLNLIPMNAIARSIATNRNQQNPAFYILIADQNPRSIQSVIWKEFLGIKTAFSNGPAKFYDKYKLPFAYMKVNPAQQPFHYQVDFEYPDNSSKNDPTKWYSQRLENQILEAPEYWLWSHKRWKRKYSEPSDSIKE